MRCLNLMLHRETYWLCKMLLCYSLINTRLGDKKRKRIYNGEIDDGKVIDIYENSKRNFFKFSQLLNRFELKYKLENMRELPWATPQCKVRKFMKNRLGWEQKSIKYKSGRVFRYPRGIYESWWLD